MGAFWDYFKNELRWPLIHREGGLSAVAGGGANSLDTARDAIIWLRSQFLPSTCDADYVDAFGRSRALVRWPNETDASWLYRVVNAYRFFKTGGRKAGLEQFLTLAGISCEIIEPKDLRALMTSHLALDGTWTLDGTVELLSEGALAGYPYIDWAEFIVRADLASASDPNWQSLARRMVSEFKPARSLPIWSYWIDMEILARPTLEIDLELSKEVVLQYPWCTLRLDGSWSVGSDEVPYSLDGSLSLDGSWQVGGALYPAMSEVVLKQCTITTEMSMTKEIVRDSRYITVQLGDPLLMLDGSWQVGQNHVLTLAHLTITKTP